MIIYTKGREEGRRDLLARKLGLRDLLAKSAKGRGRRDFLACKLGLGEFSRGDAGTQRKRRGLLSDFFSYTLKIFQIIHRFLVLMLVIKLQLCDLCVPASLREFFSLFLIAHLLQNPRHRNCIVNHPRTYCLNIT